MSSSSAVGNLPRPGLLLGCNSQCRLKDGTHATFSGPEVTVGGRRAGGTEAHTIATRVSVTVAAHRQVIFSRKIATETSAAPNIVTALLTAKSTAEPPAKNACVRTPHAEPTAAKMPSEALTRSKDFKPPLRT